MLPQVGLLAGVAKAGSAPALFSKIGALAGLSNPLTTGLGILQGVGGLFGSKSESNSSAAYSGVGGFRSDNMFDFSYKKPFFELDNPVHIAAAAALILVAAYAYKKVK